MEDEHVLTRVLQNTQSGEDFRNFCLVDRRWLQVMRRLFKRWHIFNNHLQKIIPNGMAINAHLIMNPNFTWEMCQPHLPLPNRYVKHALANPHLIWHFISIDANLRISDNVLGICINPGGRLNGGPDTSTLSTNPEITWAVVNANPQIPWDYHALSYNTSIITRRYAERSWQYIASAIHRNWNFTHVVQVLGPNWDVILAYPGRGWDREYLTRIAPPELLNTGEHSAFWNVSGLVRHPLVFTGDIDIPGLTGLPTIWDVITEGRTALLSFSISANPSLTWEMVLKHTEIPWIFNELSANPGILQGSLDVVKNNPDRNWSYKSITTNPSLWVSGNEYGVSGNPKIWDCIAETPTSRWVQWDWGYLTANLPLECILESPAYPWNMSVLSGRTDLTYDIVRANNYDWDTFAISKNHFGVIKN